MQDSDSFIFHISNSQVEHVYAAESALITPERSQKLDLLIHLIANLRQTLIICGEYGIGKTTLLNEFQQRKENKWLMIPIKASADLSFESIQQQLTQHLKQQFDEYEKLDLSLILPQLDKRNKKVVIIIDDAGLLVAGLISALIQYAAVTTCLRVVCALTDEEIITKNDTDRAIENCHLIEIPALTERQCEVFLQNLSSQPVPLIQSNQINVHLVEKVFRVSQGIPGKIISELPKLVNGSFGGNHLLVVALISILVALTISYLSNDSEELKLNLDTDPEIGFLKEKEKTAVLPIPSTQNIELKKDRLNNIKQNVNVTNSESPQQIIDSLDVPVEKNILGLKPKEDVLKVKKKAVTKAKIESPGVQKKVKTVSIAKVKKLAIKKTETIKPTKLFAKIDDNSWGLKQSQKNYTIQLMVLSTPQALSSFLNKYQKIQKNIKFFLTNQNGQKKYTLVYGSFETTEIAKNKMKLLPVEFRKSWIRQFSSLQKELKK